MLILNKKRIEPERLAAHLQCFDDDLKRVAKAIMDAKFAVAEDACRSIEARAENLGLERVVYLCEDLKKVLQKGETWTAIDHFVNTFQRSIDEVIVPLRFKVVK